MRTQQEIVEYYRKAKADDMFGFTWEILVPYLTAAQAKEFCKPDADLSDWEILPLTEEFVQKEAAEYMEFAWGKAENHRGLSASRSIEKMRAYMWLLGNDRLYAVLNDGAMYAQYGAPMLKAVCEEYEWPIPDDEGICRMMEGLPCRDGCEEGCGR